MKKSLFLVSIVVASAAASPALAAAKMSQDSVEPGTSVLRRGQSLKLHSGSLKVGESFTPYAALLGIEINGPTVVSIVPSIDTAVCEEQSHLMGESPDLKPGVQRIVISRDTPMAQTRFQKEAQLQNVAFHSDFLKADFGKKTGLLIEETQLLARTVVVIDSKGIIRHVQVVKDISTLPDMKKAFELANSL